MADWIASPAWRFLGYHVFYPYSRSIEISHAEFKIPCYLVIRKCTKFPHTLGLPLTCSCETRRDRPTHPPHRTTRRCSAQPASTPRPPARKAIPRVTCSCGPRCRVRCCSSFAAPRSARSCRYLPMLARTRARCGFGTRRLGIARPGRGARAPGGREAGGWRGRLAAGGGWRG